MGSFWADAWASFKAAFGPVLTGAVFVLALLGPLYAPAAVVQVSLIWLGVGGLIALAVLWTAANVVVIARRNARPRLPRTLQVMLSEGRDPAIRHR